jgi:hypothetical protein
VTRIKGPAAHKTTGIKTRSARKPEPRDHHFRANSVIVSFAYHDVKLGCHRFDERRTMRSSGRVQQVHRQVGCSGKGLLRSARLATLAGPGRSDAVQLSLSTVSARPLVSRSELDPGARALWRVLFKPNGSALESEHLSASESRRIEPSGLSAYVRAMLSKGFAKLATGSVRL